MIPHSRSHFRAAGAFAALVAAALLVPVAAAQDDDFYGGPCAVTPGGWGAQPAGENPGQLLHDNFDAVFGDALVVGHLVFEDAQAVTDAMPYNGPGSAFLSHAVALEINLAFGAAGLLDGTVQDVTVDIDGNPYDGWTAQQVLAEAERILREEGAPGPGEHSDLITAMTGLNEGTFDYDCHALPPCPSGMMGVALADGDIELTWNAVADAESYNVYRATGDGDFVLIANVDVETYTDTATMPGVTYTYAVTTLIGSRESIGCGDTEVTAIPYFGTVVASAAAVLGAVGAFRLVRRRG